MHDGQDSLATQTPAASGADEDVAAFTQNYLAKLLGKPNGNSSQASAAASVAAPPKAAPPPPPPAAPAPARATTVERAAAPVFAERQVAFAVPEVPAPVVKAASSADNKAVLEDLTARLQPFRQVAASVARSAIADHRADRRKSLIVIASLIGAAALLLPVLFWAIR